MLRNFILKLRIRIFSEIPRNTAKYAVRYDKEYLHHYGYLPVHSTRTYVRVRVRVATLNDSVAKILQLTSLEVVR
jgi:hypothetical protein